MTNEHLLTILKEAEAVINSRPLVYIGDDINSTVAVTPSHFLTLTPKARLPVFKNEEVDDTDYNPVTSSAERLLHTWRKGLKHLNNFWDIRRNE